MSDPVIAALGGDLEALKKGVVQLRILTQEAKNDSAKAMESVDQVARVLGELVDRLDQEDATGPRKIRPSWFALDDVEDVDAGETLADLIRWVERVFYAFPDARTALGECWLWHSWAIEELLALRAAWADAFAGKAGMSSRAAMDWLERHRLGTVARLKASLEVCSIDHHVPGGKLDQPTPVVPNGLHSAAGRIAEWWSDPSRSLVPPAPTPDEISAARSTT